MLYPAELLSHIGSIHYLLSIVKSFDDRNFRFCRFDTCDFLFGFRSGKSDASLLEIFNCTLTTEKKVTLLSDRCIQTLSLFNQVLQEQGELDDEQDKLIILDYLVIDYVKQNNARDKSDKLYGEIDGVNVSNDRAFFPFLFK